MPTHNKKSPEEVARWREALETGIGYAAVARQFDARVETVRRHCPGMGFQPHTEADYANWEAALNEGYAYKHVAEMYGVDQHTVSRKFPDRGWTLEQAQKHGALMSANASVLK